MTNKAKNDTHVVNVRMKNQTINKIEELKDLLHASSRSDTVRRAIDICELLAKEAKKGGKLIIKEGKNLKEIVIPGLAS